MTSKNCSTCKELKPLSEFNIRQERRCGVRSNCKLCEKIRRRNFCRTKAGLSSKIYNNQKVNSETRGDVKPSYTLDEFRKWLFNHNKFIEIFNTWVNSGYKKELTPSPDRINDYLPYTFDNLNLVAWKENEARGNSDIKNGINNKINKSVIQTEANGLFVAEYHSQLEASRKTGVDNSSISKCCLGKNRTAGGFKWLLK